MTNFVFQTARLKARNFTIDDVKILNALHSDKILVSTTSGNTQTIEETTKEIAEIVEHNRQHKIAQLAFFDKEKFVGRCGIIYRSFATKTDYSYEIRYAVHRHFQGLGYGSEMVSGYLDFIFTNHHQIEIITAGVRLDGHEASSKILTKLKFRYTGNKIFLGNGKETKMYEINRKEWLGLE